jgi:hypothetical protein
MLAAVVIMCSLMDPPQCYPQEVYPVSCDDGIKVIENPVEIDNVIYTPTRMVWCGERLVWIKVEQDSETAVLDAWGVLMDRLTRLKNIIDKSYLHRDGDKELIGRVKQQLSEIESYVDNIEARVKW